MKNTIEKLTEFVNQRPGLDFANYGDSKSYNSESREITKDRSDFFELLSLFLARYEGAANEKLEFNLRNSNGRLVLLENGRLEYTTGQYFPTEYRPAANHVLAQLIWNSYSSEMQDTKSNGMENVYKDGHEIRKALRRRLSRRIMNNYFN